VLYKEEAMLFALLGKFRSGPQGERIAHRARWQYPAGIRVIGEYWLQSGDVDVVTIFEADTTQAIMTLTSEWADNYAITVVPAMTAEEGLKWTAQKMGAKK
jgi:hypothetical protein